MVSPSWNMKRNKIADIKMGEGDFGWKWLVEGIGIVEIGNICYIRGIINDEQNIVGKL